MAWSLEEWGRCLPLPLETILLLALLGFCVELFVSNEAGSRDNSTILSDTPSIGLSSIIGPSPIELVYGKPYVSSFLYGVCKTLPP